MASGSFVITTWRYTKLNILLSIKMHIWYKVKQICLYTGFTCYSIDFKADVKMITSTAHNAV